MSKKQISSRISVDSIQDYIEKFKQFEKQVNPDVRPTDLTMTRVLEDALFYATKYLESQLKK